MDLRFLTSPLLRLISSLNCRRQRDDRNVSVSSSTQAAHEQTEPSEKEAEEDEKTGDLFGPVCDAVELEKELLVGVRPRPLRPTSLPWPREESRNQLNSPIHETDPLAHLTPTPDANECIRAFESSNDSCSAYEVSCYCQELKQRIRARVKMKIGQLRELEGQLMREIELRKSEILATLPAATDDAMNEKLRLAADEEDGSPWQRFIVWLLRHRQRPTTLSGLRFEESDASGYLGVGQVLWEPEGPCQIETCHLHSLRNSSKLITEMVFLADGNLATCSDDNRVKLWGLETGVEARELRRHLPALSSLAVLANGWLACGANDGLVRLWDVRESTAPRRVLRSHDKRVLKLLALDDGRLVSCSADSSIRVWSVENERPLLSMRYEFNGRFRYELGARCGFLMLARLNRYLQAELGNGLEIWSLEDGAHVRSLAFEWRARSLVFLAATSADLAVALENGSLCTVDLLRFHDDSGGTRVLDDGRRFSARLVLELDARFLLAVGSDLETQTHLVNIFSLADDHALLHRFATRESVESAAVSRDCSLLALKCSSSVEIYELSGVRRSSERPRLARSMRLRPNYRLLELIDQDACYRTYLSQNVGSATNSKRVVVKKSIGLVGHASALDKNRSFSEFGELDSSFNRLRHPNLVALLDSFDFYGKWLSKSSYLVFENYHELVSLRQYVSGVEDASRPLHCVSVVRWLGQLADVLVFLHSKDTSHGNLTTRNIYLDGDGSAIKVGVLDLPNFMGKEVKVVETRLEDLRFFSPERILGKDRKLSPSDDCWSFGCVLFELVSLKPAFGGTDYLSVTKAIVEGGPPKIGSPDFEPLYLKTMVREADRISSVHIQDILCQLKKQIILDETNIDEYTKFRAANPEFKSRLKYIDSGCFRSFKSPDVLDLSHNHFSSVESAQFEPLSEAGVVELRLDHNRLEQIDDALAHFTQLKALALNQNCLNLLDANFGELANLRCLNLSKNKIESLEQGLFDSLTSLESLDLSYNLIHHIDKSALSRLEKLQRLDLSHNRLAEIRPDVLTSLSNLFVFKVDHNHLVKIDSLLFEKTTRLLSLELNNNCIAVIDKGAFDGLVSLRKLDLSSNHLARLDDGLFERLGNLKTLNLRSNRLVQVNHVRFGKLRKLSGLDLSDNQIRDLDLDVFNETTRLRELHLSDNNLDAINTSQWNRRQAFRVHISGNRDGLFSRDALEKLIERGIIPLFDHIKPIKSEKTFILKQFLN